MSYSTLKRLLSPDYYSTLGLSNCSPKEFLSVLTNWRGQLAGEIQAHVLLLIEGKADPQPFKSRELSLLLYLEKMVGDVVDAMVEEDRDPIISMMQELQDLYSFQNSLFQAMHRAIPGLKLKIFFGSRAGEGDEDNSNR